MSEPTTNHFPHKGPRKTGMRCSLGGVLRRAADKCRCSRDMKHLEFPLQELEKHINEMRTAKNDQQALMFLDEFLSLWVEG